MTLHLRAVLSVALTALLASACASAPPSQAVVAGTYGWSLGCCIGLELRLGAEGRYELQTWSSDMEAPSMREGRWQFHDGRVQLVPAASSSLGLIASLEVVTRHGVPALARMEDIAGQTVHESSLLKRLPRSPR
ncbi:hypothetical protein [Lysobacter sp. A3-1-A15]|uniref:hypothetical protein n=1 Tax=Novilysobacter viscosus TaxID=3098602 RepID=UPI002ED87E3E